MWERGIASGEEWSNLLFDAPPLGRQQGEQ